LATYLFIGLILLLAAYLVRARRGRPKGASNMPSRARAPKPSARAEPPPAVAYAETAAAAPTLREPLTAPSPPMPMVDPALSWTPEETIVEPGWPLPGEIAGGWSSPVPAAAGAPFPDGATPPVAVLEWERPSADLPAAQPDPVADRPDVEEWAMPSFDTATPVVPTPPMWIPGEAGAEGAITPSSGAVDMEPIWHGEPLAGAVATEESAATVALAEPVSAGEAPAFVWGPPEALPEPVADHVAPAIAGDPAPGLVWASETPVPPAEGVPVTPWNPSPVEPPFPAEPEPEAEVAPATEWEGLPADDGVPPLAPAEEPVPTYGTTFTPAPVWGETVTAEPAPVADVTVGGIPAAEPPADLDTWTPAPSPVPALEGAVPFTRVCDRLGVTPRMLALMRMLAETPRSVSEQARELGVSRPLIADLCTRLESIGLARRKPVATDRRRIRITLTAAGHRLCAETAGTPGGDSLEAVVGRLSPAERARLLSSLQARQ